MTTETQTETSPARTTRRLPLAERRTRLVVARLTEHEGDLIEKAAAAAGVSLSDLVRTAALAAAAGTTGS